MRVVLQALRLLLVAAVAFAGCPEDIERPTVNQVEPGGPCVDNDECASGLCNAGLCAAPNTLPIADPGPNRVTLVNVPVTLDGGGSNDPDDPDNAEAITYAWSLTTQPAAANASISGEATPSVGFTADQQGVYELELAVTDVRGGVSRATVAVFVLDEDGTFKLPEGAPCETGSQCAAGKCVEGVCAANQLPIAKGGVSATVPVGEPVALDASGSSDPDGDTLTFSWELSQLPAGSTTVLTSADAVASGFTPDVEGLYVVRLRVNDGYISSLPDTVGFMAVVGQADLRPDGESCEKDDECESQFCFEGACKTNEAPVAIAGKAVIVQVGTEVALDGGQSSDPEGLALTYSWGLNEVSPTDPEATSAAAIVDPAAGQTTFTPDVAGVFVLRLVVNDGMLDSLPEDFVIYADPDPVDLLPEGESCNADLECQSDFCFDSACAINQAPVAEAGDTQIVDVGTDVTVDGSGSNDPEGFAITHVWELTDAPAGSAAALNDASLVAPSFTADLVGPYTLRLTVSDGDLSTTDVVTIVAEVPSNKPDGDDCADHTECTSGYCDPATQQCATNVSPAAVISSNAPVDAGTAVLLDGSSSSDPESASLTYAWLIESAPAGSAAALDDDSGVAAQFTADLPGVYTVSLVVNDGFQNSPKVVEVIVANSTTGLPNGDPCAGDVQCASGYCDVTGSGDCATNAVPLATIAAPTTIELATGVALDGSGSADADGHALTFVWSLDQAPVGSNATLTDATLANASFVPDVVGVYLVSLVVSDGYDASQPAFTAITVTDPALLPDDDACTDDSECISGYCHPSNGICATNQVPVALIIGDAEVVADTAASLDASGSSDPEGAALTYAWTLFDAPTGSAAAIADPMAALTSITPDVEGAYVIGLTVNDGYVDSVVVTHVLVATSVPDGGGCADDSECTSGFCHLGACATNSPPTAVMAPIASVQVGNLAVLDGTGSNDAEGSALTYAWSILSAPAGNTAAVADPTAPSTTLTPDAVGNYVIGLVVADGYDASAMVTRVLVATPAPLDLPNGDPCTADIECSSGYCNALGVCACLATTCAELGAQCGAPDNGCGDALDCGTCNTGEACDASNQCQCVPLTCADQGYECGTWDDACGTGLNCGSCAAPPSGEGTHTCTPAGTCDLQCNAGWEACNGDCIDPLNDPAHCGGCGVADCGTLACDSGFCETVVQLAIVSGDNQTVGLGEPTPILSPLRILVTNTLTGQPVNAHPVSVTPSAGGHSGPMTGTTDASGFIDLQLWTGLQPGAYTFDITGDSSANTVQATLNASPVTGTMYPVTNHSRSSIGGASFVNVPGPSTQVLHGNLPQTGLDIASDGTIYVSNIAYHEVIQISPEGHTTKFAGTTAGYSGDGGPAVDAQFFQPYGVAVDEALGRVYVMDKSNRRIRYVDLADGNIYPFAGGGAAGGTNGDGGAALSAYINNAWRVMVGPDSKVYFSDDANRIRVIDNGIVDHFIGANYDNPSQTQCWAQPQPTVYGCGGGSYGYSCDMAWAPSGDILIAAEVCGDSADPGAQFDGILRIDTNGNRSIIAGTNAGSYGVAGVPGRNFRFYRWLTGINVDAVGNIYLTNTDWGSSTGDYIWRLDARTSIVTEVAAGATGGSGDYGPIGDAEFDDIVASRFDNNGNLIFIERYGGVVRGVANLADDAFSDISLVKHAGDAQTHTIGAVMAPSPAARVLDGTGTPILGAEVTYTTNDPGVHPQSAVVQTAAPSMAAEFAGRMGLGLEPVEVTAEYRDIYGNHIPGSPAVFTLTPEPPADGDIFTAVNVQKVGGSTLNSAATTTRLNAPRSSCVGPDGSVFIADRSNHRVIQVTPQGHAIRVAGTGSAGYSGENGPANLAQLSNPYDCGYDAANDILYIADGGNAAVRGVDMASGLIFLYAGRGALGGENVHRLDTTFTSLTRIAVAPDGSAVYTAETGAIANTRFRRIDAATNLVTALLRLGNPGCTASPVAMQSCEPDYCAIEVGPGPTHYLYYAGNMCGTDFGGNTWVGGVSRYDPGTATWTGLVGTTTDPTGDGNPAASTYFTWGTTRDVAVGPDGTLFLAEGPNHVIRRIDGATTIVSTVAGTGTSGNTGEFVPATSATLNNPRAVAVHPDGHLLITGESNHALRWVWNSCSDDSDCLTTGNCNTTIGACTQP